MTTRPLIIADIAELVFLLTLEAGAVVFFFGVSALWLGLLSGVL